MHVPRWRKYGLVIIKCQITLQVLSYIKPCGFIIYLLFNIVIVYDASVKINPAQL